MKQIMCNIATFDLHQRIMLVDTVTKEIQTIAISNLDDLSEHILSLCLKHNAQTIVLGGNYSFINPYVEEIQALNENKYNINNIEIEVL